MTAFLPEIWFGLIVFLFTGYAILDGFDLGVGIIHFVRSDEAERRIRMNAIGPIWDGNEVWLVTAGGALFAAFPEAYATIFSGFYGAMMMLLAALILRAVSLEFRGKLDVPVWRRVWDTAFSAGSLLVALLFGVAIGNLLQGLPLSPEKEYLGGLPGLLNPFGLFTGLVAVCVFAMHGALYLMNKGEGTARATALTVARFTAPVAVLSSLVMVNWSLTFEHLTAVPGGVMNGAVFSMGLILALELFIPRRSPGIDRGTFIFSSAFIATLALHVATGIFPAIVRGTPGTTNLMIREAASSSATLFNMLIIAGIGMPLVLGYSWYIHRVFRGPVRLDDASY
jgi:cytochrome d ubiquinol oxidase subunit II